MFVVFWQAVLSFVVLLALTRMIGKQQVSQLTYYEYINGITFGSIAANMATDDLVNLTDHLVGLLTYGVLTIAVAYISLKNRKMRKIINGEPVVVIQDGKILEDNLRKMKLNIDELTMLLRLKDVFDFTQVKLAIVEQSGSVSVIKKPDFEQPTRADLGIRAKAQSLGIEVIADGKVITENLKRLKLDETWLSKQLAQRRITNINKVMYAAVDDQGKLTVDLYREGIEEMLDMSDGEDIPFTADRDNDYH